MGRRPYLAGVIGCREQLGLELGVTETLHRWSIVSRTAICQTGALAPRAPSFLSSHLDDDTQKVCRHVPHGLRKEHLQHDHPATIIEKSLLELVCLVSSCVGIATVQVKPGPI